ncbi:RagB/SusD family nutrient uptake outer membrane protein [Pedobacter sp. MW01-1-1]|uniref:RagB/SusD family nutrient uptake outer membrane protein n=1 Tax=Pedobacter sp. MW01-1-1 TaxID=3383027 RepID=UPI003FEE265C
MKKYKVYVILLVLLSSGCKKYLEVAPDMRTTLNSPEKISELLVTAYPSGNYVMVAEAMSDNPVFVNESGEVYTTNQNPFNWLDIDATDQDTPGYYWSNCYEAIAAANHALYAIDKAKNPQQYVRQKGEALVARAFAHFMLVTLFSKCYDESTASSDMGIPYVTEPEIVVVKNYDRKTVAYVYGQIERDLLEGIPLINDNAYKVPAYHFTKKAAYAFAARFYLFKKEYDKVIQYANLAFPTNNFAANVRPWFDFASPTGGSTEVAQNMSKASNPGNLLLAQTTSWLANRYKQLMYGLTQTQLKAITTPLGINFNAYKTYNRSSTFYYIPKHYNHFVYSSINATTGKSYVMQSLLTTEEVLLNRAEALIMKNNFSAALEDINTLISQRVNGFNSSTDGLTENKITDYYKGSTTDQKQMYLNALMDVKRAEFLGEGMRWFDILRLKMPVTHVDRYGKTIELAADDLRKVWQLPSEVTLSGMPLNPR